ncbi:threonine/serine exporter family protein [Streptomyces sp. NRRL F-5193]|uniref:threonine/serine exporter family protein n=1 Tax=Streptomyces sp. NRRL F-5193 TaxID=1463860 RepID=UPI001F352F8F|nr:threonine/serine exporter family protein [Streptomyces sp. NRRL F-5193]
MARPAGDPQEPVARVPGRAAGGGTDGGPDAELDRIASFLTRLTGLLLRTSGEGSELIAREVGAAGRALGAEVSVLLVMETATLTVTVPDGRTRTVIVYAAPEVARLDRIAALKPLVADVRAGRAGAAEASARLDRIEAAPAPYPWWLKLLGIVLFSLGFAPLMQPTWYELGTTAVLATTAAALAVASDRVPRLARVLPLVASLAVSVVTLELFAGDPANGGPVLLMLPALFFFVPGDYLSAAAAELGAGLVTTGAIRLVYAVFLLVQLCVGVLLGVYGTGTSTRALFDTAADADLPRWVLFASWTVFTVGTLLAFAIPRRFFWHLLALVYLTVAVQSAATALVGETGGTFVAAVVLAAVATLLSRGPDRPPRLLLVLPGFFTLTVGSLGMRGLTTLAGGHVVDGFSDLLELVLVVTAIAVGLVLGATLVPDRKAGGEPPVPSG